MNAIHIATIIFIILYLMECHTSWKYKKILDELLQENNNERD